MVAQSLYDTVADEFFDTLRAEGVELRNCSQTLYTYNGGAWGVISLADTAEFEKRIYPMALTSNLSIAEKIKPMWNTLRMRADTLDADLLDAQPMLALPNGTLDPTDGTLYEHDPEHYTTRRIKIEYDPDAKCPEWLAMLERIFDKLAPDDAEEHVRFLQEFFGMSLCGFKPGTDRGLRKALILYGAAKTAKTSVAEVLREFFRPDEICVENIDQLSGEYGLAKLASARALISDDAVGLKSKTNAMVLKKIITGEPLSANRKHKDFQDFRFRGPVVFTTNIKPKIEDETDALFDRTVLLTFDRRFGDADKKKLGKYGSVVPFLKAKDEFPGILNWALQGMARALDRQGYSEVAAAKESSRAWRADNDVVFDFLTRYGAEDEGSFCSVSALAESVSVFAAHQHHDRTFSPKMASNRIVREVSLCLPGARVERVDRSKVSGNIVCGIKLNTEGLAWYQRALEDGRVPPGVKWELNGKLM